MRFEQRSTNGTDAFFTEQDIMNGLTGDEARRKIDWKTIKGGLKWSYKPFTLFLTATGVTFTIRSVVKRGSNQNSCEPIWASQQSDDGTQGINFYCYLTITGLNCDTTAQSKTIATAIEDAWNAATDKKYDYACIYLSHGGTWHGHPAIATTTSGVDVETLCQEKD
ncbi:hypothetical protein BDV10DRAFT_182604 [Aspergillus recurvatus]